MMWCPSCQLFILLLALAIHQDFLVSGWLFSGKLTTTKSMYYVGENLTANCIKSSDFTGVVGFQKGNRPFNQTYVTEVNATLAVLNTPVTDDYDGQITLTCIEDGRTVASSTVYTDYSPQNATDLEMVWLDQRNLSMTWAYNNIPYKNGHSEMLIKVTGEWAYSASGVWYECYSEKLRGASCLLPEGTITDDFAQVFVRVNITNVKRNNRVTTVFPGLKIREHVKPLPVESLTVNALNSRTVRVTVTADQAELAYNITYYNTFGMEEPFIVMTNKTSNKSFDITALHPNFSYKFEVRSKYDVNRGYLSDPFTSSPITMPEDAPAAAPTVTPGSFYRPLCSASENYTVAYVYFQELAYKDKNGEIVNYTATVVHNGRNVTYRQRDSTSTIKLDSVPCSSHFDVTLRAYTAVGSSPPSVLRLPAWDEVNKGNVDKLKMMIKSTDTGIEAEWQPTPSIPGTTFLLYYCNKYSADTAMCHDSIQYVSISTETGSHLLPSANANMNFGVASISQNSATNGIQFTRCLYDPTKGPGDAPELQPIQQTNPVTLRWVAPEACDAIRRYIILSYEIKVCHTQCQAYVVDGSSNSYDLGEVAVNTNYTVTIRANTTNNFTEFSTPQSLMVRPVVSGLKSGEIAGIVSGTLVGAIIIGILVFCVYSCRGKYLFKKSMFKKALNLPSPAPKPAFNKSKKFDDTLGGTQNKAYTNSDIPPKVTPQQQDSSDSGYSGNNDSPPNSPLGTNDKKEVAMDTRPNGYTMVTSASLPHPSLPDGGGDGGVNCTDSTDLEDLTGIVLSVHNGPLSTPGPQLFFPTPACFKEDPDKDEEGFLKDDGSMMENENYVRCSTRDDPQDGAQPTIAGTIPGITPSSTGTTSYMVPPSVGTTHDIAPPDVGTNPLTAPPASQAGPGTPECTVNFLLADLSSIPVPVDFLDERDVEDEAGGWKDSQPKSLPQSVPDSSLGTASLPMEQEEETQQFTPAPANEENNSAGQESCSGYIARHGANGENTPHLPDPAPQDSKGSLGYVSHDSVATSQREHVHRASVPADDKNQLQRKHNLEATSDLPSLSLDTPLPSTVFNVDGSLAVSVSEGSNPEVGPPQNPRLLAQPSAMGYLPHSVSSLSTAPPNPEPSEMQMDQVDQQLQGNPPPDSRSQGYVSHPDNSSHVPQPTPHYPNPSTLGSKGYVGHPENNPNGPRPSSHDAAFTGQPCQKLESTPLSTIGSTGYVTNSENRPYVLQPPTKESYPFLKQQESTLGSMGYVGRPENSPHVPEPGTHDPETFPGQPEGAPVSVLGSTGCVAQPQNSPQPTTMAPNPAFPGQPINAPRSTVGSTEYETHSGEDPPLLEPGEDEDDIVSSVGLNLQRLDSGYFSPPPRQAPQPLFSSLPQDSVQGKGLVAKDCEHPEDALLKNGCEHSEDAPMTGGNMSCEERETVATGEGVDEGQQDSTLGGTLIMSFTSSGYVSREASPSDTPTSTC